MQIARRTGGFDFHIDQAAQSYAEGGKPFGVKRGVGNERDVGLQLGRIFCDITGDGSAADFLFAFDQELEIHRERAVYRAQGLDGLDVHVHLAFVVGGSAGVDVAVAHGGLEGRALPELQRVGRLDVVMAVTKNGWLALGVQPIAIDQRIAIGRNDLDMLDAGVFQAIGDEVGGSLDVGLVLGQSADAGDAEKILKLFEEAGLVLLDKRIGGLRHGRGLPSLWQTRSIAAYAIQG